MIRMPLRKRLPHSSICTTHLPSGARSDARSPKGGVGRSATEARAEGEPHRRRENYPSPRRGEKIFWT